MKIKYSFIPFIIGLLFLVPYGICQMLQIGFINNFKSVSSDLLYNIFGVIAFAFIIIILLFSFLSKDVPNTVKIGKSYSLGILATIISLLLICSEGSNLILIILYWSYIPQIIEIAILSILAILAGVTFIIFSAGYFSGNNLFDKHKFLALFPSFWLIVRFALHFISNTAVSTTKLELLAIVEMGLALLFLFNHARQFVPVENKNSTKRLFAYGFSFILISLIYNISVITLKFQGTADYNSGYSVNCIISLFLAIYVLVLLIKITTKLNRPAIENDDDIESKIDKMVEEVYCKIEEDESVSN